MFIIENKQYQSINVRQQLKKENDSLDFMIEFNSKNKN